jgi:hypothetical protein
MTIGLAVFLVGHGLIHLLGVAKALEVAELPQLTRPIGSAMGIVWLAAETSHVLGAFGRAPRLRRRSTVPGRA